MFFEILFNNSIAWLFSVLTLGIHSFVVLFEILFTNNEHWQVLKNHYLFEIASLLLIPCAVFTGIIKYLRSNIFLQSVKPSLIILFVSYTFLVLAAYLESNAISNL